jgi:hypothetical protein
MTSALGISEIEGHQSVALTPEPERARLAEARAASCSLLMERITMLKDSVAKNEQIFHKYEHSLKTHGYDLIYSYFCVELSILRNMAMLYILFQ